MVWQHHLGPQHGDVDEGGKHEQTLVHVHDDNAEEAIDLQIKCDRFE